MNPYKYDFKDQSPIRFELFQSDVEKLMFALDEAMRVIATVNYGDAGHSNINELLRMLSNIKDDFQHKINIHRERGEWK